MITRWRWLLGRLAHKLWLRAALLSLLGVVSALLAIVLAPLIPENLSASIGADAVDSILGILASSMLMVTSFSLTTMVAAYSTATNNVTPRATELLVEDPTSQNALSTFIGSFLYSLVGIIALTTGVYGSRGRVVLFVATIAVIVLIVVALVRWIDHLARLGRVADTTDRVERVTTAAMRSRIENPYLGGAFRDRERSVPDGARPLRCSKIGYVQHLDVNALSRCAEKFDADVYVDAPPGTFVEPSRPIAWVVDLDERNDDVLRASFTIEDARSFEHDPRFGLSVLAEIASRALSPAMNDPGTAIDVIGRGVRLLALWSSRDGSAPSEDVPCPRVRVPGLDVSDMFDDVFAPIARDGASIVEVQIRLQKALLALSRIGGARFSECAAHHARLALVRSEGALMLEEERGRVREVAAETLSRATALRRSASFEQDSPP